MAIGFIRREPTIHSRLHDNLEVVTIFQKMGWMKFFDMINGYDDGIAIDFSRNYEETQEQEFVTQVKGMQIVVNEEVVSQATRIPRVILGKNMTKKPIISLINVYLDLMKFEEKDTGSSENNSLNHARNFLSSNEIYHL